MLTHVRIDKYLWSVRIFKSRNIAAEECKKSNILVNGINVKPSHNIKEGDKIQIKSPPIIKSFLVVGLIEKRTSAALAKQYISEVTPLEEYNKLNEFKTNTRMAFEKHDKGAGRPTKKDRREIDKFKSSI
mgnify:CR=1 FL=1